MSLVSVGLKTGKRGKVIELLEKTFAEKMVRRKSLYSGDTAYCPRRGALHIATPDDVKETNDIVGAIYQGVGIGAHDAVGSWFGLSGKLVASEAYYKNKVLGLGGYIDAVILLDGEHHIVELKTIGKKLPKKPKLKHVFQAATYSVVSGIDNTHIVYISRDVAKYTGGIRQLKAVEFSLEDSIRRSGIDLRKEALKNVAFAAAGVELKIIPNIPRHIKYKSHCKYCPFFQTCWEDEITQVFESDFLFQDQLSLEDEDAFYKLAQKKAKKILNNKSRKDDFLRTLKK